ncbi:MAG: phytanoyl-CoA dioxygenase family protein [Candidatus Hydrogenedentes bacterium]|nr:phytanoyl-CoA dioxygenase family protein [Candidatus Hydrogenedentota bacterium]
MQEDFNRAGYIVAPHVLNPNALKRLTTLLEALELERADHNRQGKTFAMRDIFAEEPELLRFASAPPLLDLARLLAGHSARPTKATYFDKRPEANWSLPLHQDMTITVHAKVDIPGYTHWSIKAGVPHVQPPVRVLEGIVALRIHLDDCPAENGALEVVPGSHLQGRISAEELRMMHMEGRPVICPARAGDVLAMRPLLVHGSSKARVPKRRRVLHVEYATTELDAPLQWPLWSRLHAPS